MQRSFAHRLAKDLQLRVSFTLETLHQDEVARRDALQQLRERCLSRIAQLVHLHPAAR